MPDPLQFMSFHSCLHSENHVILISPFLNLFLPILLHVSLPQLLSITALLHKPKPLICCSSIPKMSVFVTRIEYYKMQTIHNIKCNIFIFWSTSVYCAGNVWSIRSDNSKGKWSNILLLIPNTLLDWKEHGETWRAAESLCGTDLGQCCGHVWDPWWSSTSHHQQCQPPEEHKKVSLVSKQLCSDFMCICKIYMIFQ